MMAARMATVLAVVAIPLLAGCGNEERDSVERYIERANAIQERYAPEFREANDAYARFAKGEITAIRAEVELGAAERALRDAEAQLARVDAPPRADRLHEQLLHVVEMNADFAAENTALARYLPGARQVLQHVAGTGAALSSRLRAAETPERQSAALARYGREIDRQHEALSALRPPPILRATHRDQLRRLTSSRRLARRLRTAAEARDSRRVAELVLEFRKVSRRNGRTGLTRRAVRAYNKRYAAIGEATAAMRREQQQLEQQLG
jgi:hypothetical protein